MQQPTYTPDANHYVIGVRTFSVGQLVSLTENEQQMLDELALLFNKIQDSREDFYRRIHTADTTFSPELHGMCLQSMEDFAEFQLGTQALAQAISNRMGGWLPVQPDYHAEGGPKVFVRAARPEDPLFLSTQQIAATSGFGRQIADARTFALAINNSFSGKALQEDTEISYSQWISMNAPFVRVLKVNPALLAENTRVSGFSAIIMQMLTTGGVLEEIKRTMMQAGTNQRAQFRFTPLGVVVTEAEIRVINLEEVADGSGSQFQRQLSAVAKHMKAMSPTLDGIKFWSIVQYQQTLPVPPANAISEKDEVNPGALTSGFLISTMTDVDCERVNFFVDLNKVEVHGVVHDNRYPRPTPLLMQLLSDVYPAAPEMAS